MLIRSHLLKTALIMGIATLISGCKTTPDRDISYEGWQSRKIGSGLAYTTNDMVKINLNWSRIGPFSRYDTWVRSNVFGGQIDVYGAQTCLGQFVRNDGMLPANGWWEIVCQDESYAAGNYRLTAQGVIIGTGADINGEQVSFTLPVAN
jgi:hypothetical protein